MGTLTRPAGELAGGFFLALGLREGRVTLSRPRDSGRATSRLLRAGEPPAATVSAASFSAKMSRHHHEAGFTVAYGSRSNKIQAPGNKPTGLGAMQPGMSRLRQTIASVVTAVVATIFALGLCELALRLWDGIPLRPL